MRARRARLFLLLSALATAGAWRPASAEPARFDPRRIGHWIVIYQENWSFDGLYARFPGADGVALGEPVRQTGFDGAPIATMPRPVDDGKKPKAFTTDKWPDPMPVVFYDLLDFSSGDHPFRLESRTKDVNHRFQAHRFQVTQGPGDAWLRWSPFDRKKAPGTDNVNSVCLSAIDATGLPEGKLAREHVMCDRCFQSAFGGSFLNHQFLVAAAPPVYRNARPDAASRISEPLPAKGVPSSAYDAWDAPLLPEPTTPGGNDYVVVNTMQPPWAPTEKVGKGEFLPPQTHATIADRLDEARVSWAWFSEEWDASAAIKGQEPEWFQCHHQPFNYFERFDPDAHGPYRREHLRDLSDLLDRLPKGDVPAVSFVKFSGKNNEHPGYANVIDGQKQVADLVARVQASPVWADCAIVITYDEYGGRWDHVPPPRGDSFGPGSRVPMIVVSPFARRGFVDHTTYETVSILATIESRWALSPLTDRDRRATPLWNAFSLP
jgi:phospholipase C